MATAEFQHLTEIAATVEEAWEALIQVEDWPSFIPTVSSVVGLDGGPLGVGSRARLRQPGLPPLVWTITRFEPPSVFVWRTRLLGLTLTAHHYLDGDDDCCVQRLGIVLDGPGASVAGRLANRLVNRALAAENTGFKKRVEG